MSKVGGIELALTAQDFQFAELALSARFSSGQTGVLQGSLILKLENSVFFGE